MLTNTSHFIEIIYIIFVQTLVPLLKLFIFFVSQKVTLLSPAAPKARDGRYCSATPPPPTPQGQKTPKFLEKFLHCNLITHCCIFSKLCRYVHHVMEMCCVVFDIDGCFYLPPRRRHGDGRYCNAVRLSVRLSVMFIFRAVTLNLAGTCTMSLGCAVLFFILMECCIQKL